MPITDILAPFDTATDDAARQPTTLGGKAAIQAAKAKIGDIAAELELTAGEWVIPTQKSIAWARLIRPSTLCPSLLFSWTTGPWLPNRDTPNTCDKN